MRKRRKSQAAAAPAEPAKPPRNPAMAALKGVYRQLQAGPAAALPGAGAASAAAQQAQATAAHALEADRHWFRRKVGPVTPLAPTGRVQRGVQPPAPLPYQRWADDDAVLRESLSDDYGAEWLLETDESLSFRRQGLGADVVRKLRRGHWTVTAQIDLHGLRVDEARDAIAAFLRDCVRQERRCVRIIHGKGLGSVNRTPVLKEKVRRWLTQKDEVLAFTEARPIDGGAGVVLALLKRAHG